MILRLNSYGCPPLDDELDPFDFDAHIQELPAPRLRKRDIAKHMVADAARSIVPPSVRPIFIPPSPSPSESGSDTESSDEAGTPRKRDLLKQGKLLQLGTRILRTSGRETTDIDELHLRAWSNGTEPPDIVDE